MTETRHTADVVFPYLRVPTEIVNELWDAYRSAMKPTRADAAQRHMLTRDEFDAICRNTYVIKAVTVGPAGVTGIAAYTRHLGEHEGIDPAYFQARWPDEYERESIFYVLFVIATPGAPPGVFTNLINHIVNDIRDRKGIGALDWSSARIERGLARASRHIIGRAAPLAKETIDVQQFHTYTFDWDSEAES